MLLLLFFLILFTSPVVHPQFTAGDPSLYLSPTTLFPNYQKMVETFKIFTYKPAESFDFKSPAESIFYRSLLNSHFSTLNPDEAHLFFVPFPSDLSTRSIARVIRDLRTELPYWNRTLGADHFYISCAGIGFESDRNLVELKKNSVQISCFPTPEGKFVPHKDISLPPVNYFPVSDVDTPASAVKYLAYVKNSAMEKDLRDDRKFLVNSEKLILDRSEFCLFDYDNDMSWIGEALRMGCLPGVITDRPVQDLPFMDVLLWREIAIFVKRSEGLEDVKSALKRALGDQDRMERTRRAGQSASRHFGWNPTPEPYDAFHTTLYQLWIRRHVIRYSMWESS